MTSSKVQCKCAQCTFITWWWYHLRASPFKNSRVLNTLSLSQSSPPYMLTSNKMTRSVSHFSKSPNLEDPSYLLMDECSAHQSFVPSGMLKCTDTCSHISWMRCSCIWVWWCFTASIMPGGCTAAGTEYPRCQLRSGVIALMRMVWIIITTISSITSVIWVSQWTSAKVGWSLSAATSMAMISVILFWVIGRWITSPQIRIRWFIWFIVAVISWVTRSCSWFEGWLIQLFHFVKYLAISTEGNPLVCITRSALRGQVLVVHLLVGNSVLQPFGHEYLLQFLLWQGNKEFLLWFRTHFYFGQSNLLCPLLRMFFCLSKEGKSWRFLIIAGRCMALLIPLGCFSSLSWGNEPSDCTSEVQIFHDCWKSWKLSNFRGNYDVDAQRQHSLRKVFPCTESNRMHLLWLSHNTNASCCWYYRILFRHSMDRIPVRWFWWKGRWGCSLRPRLDTHQ